MVEAGLDFFFDMIKWSFEFLLKVKIVGIPVLYIFFAILLLGFIITALVNVPNAGNMVFASSRYNAKEASRVKNAERTLRAHERRVNNTHTRLNNRMNRELYR